MSEAVTPRFYLLYGDDSLALDAALAKMKASMGGDANADLNTDEFDAEDTDVAAILNAVCSFPFLADKRLVIARNVLRWNGRKGAGATGKKALERLADELPNLPETARLVLIERENLPDNNPILKLAQSHLHGYAKAFAVPKDSTHWIRRQAKSEYKVEIDPAAATALASVTGTDLRRADNELVKLVSYVGTERTITEDDVALLTPYVPETNIFQMIDALATGDGKTAFTLVDRVLRENPRDDGFGLFAMVVRHFRLLLLTREHLASGGSSNPGSIAKAIGVRSSWQAKKLAVQSRLFTLAQLEQIYRRLQQYDADMKVGRIRPRLVLDLLVASLARQE